MLTGLSSLSVLFFGFTHPVVHVYINISAIYTDEHNMSLFLDFITALRHVSIIQGNHHQIKIQNCKGKEV
jgi:hypothetical protein